MTHVLIIGGGPAGASAAIHLRRVGFRITLVEAKAFPRIKTCGEFISPAATAVLEDLIPPRDLIDAGARRIDQMALDWDDRSIVWRMPNPAWALSRARLDDMLMQRAVRAGAEVIQPVGVRRVEYRDTGILASLSNHESIEADGVIHADGVGRHDPRGPTRRAGGLVGWKCHARTAEAVAGVRIRAGTGAYVGTIAVENGLATCALVAHRDTIQRHGGDADALVASIWPGYDAALRTSAWEACLVPRARFTSAGHHRSFRIGNAAAAVDPVGGEGIGLALWSGRCLADVIADRPWTEDGLRLAHAEYRRSYRRRLRLRRPACRLAAEVVMRSGIVRRLAPLLGACPWTLGAWYACSGKPLRPSGGVCEHRGNLIR